MTLTDAMAGLTGRAAFRNGASKSSTDSGACVAARREPDKTVPAPASRRRGVHAGSGIGVRSDKEFHCRCPFRFTWFRKRSFRNASAAHNSTCCVRQGQRHQTGNLSNPTGIGLIRRPITASDGRFGRSSVAIFN